MISGSSTPTTRVASGNAGGVAAYIFGWADETYNVDDAPFSPNLTVWAACDNSAVSQKILLAHEGRSKPVHVFQDIMDRVPNDVRSVLYVIGDRYIKSYATLEQLHEGSMDTPPKISSDVFDARKEEMAQNMVRELNSVLCQVHFKEKAWCVKHNDYCFISPRSDPRFRSARWIDVGGHTCNPWTPMGSMNHFLDKATIPALVWVHSMRFFEPDDIIVERTPFFEPEAFHKVLNTNLFNGFNGPGFDEMNTPKSHLSRPMRFKEDPASRKYEMFTVRFSPLDLGFPTSRRRVFTWFSLGNVIQQPLSSDMKPLAFETLFFKQIKADASVFLIASTDEVVDTHQKAWAARRGEDHGELHSQDTFKPPRSVQVATS